MTELEQNFLAHTAKGTSWDKHKYLYIDKNGNYVYPEDVKNAKYGTTEYDAMMSKRGTTINNRQTFTPSKSSSSSTSSVNKTNQAAAQISTKESGAKGKGTLTEAQKKIINAADEKEAAKKKKEEEKAKKAAEKEAAKKQKEAQKAAQKASTKTKKSTKLSKEAQTLNLTDEDMALLTSNIDTNATNRADVINSLALKVIRGDFGNGQERKDKLGQFYVEIQSRVNELIKTMSPKKAKTVRKASRTSSKSTTTKTPTKTVTYGSDDYEKQKKGTTINNRKTIKHSDEEFLMHFGTKKHSGRYEYGSGERPYQHDPSARRRYRKKTSFFKRRTMPDNELDDRIARLRKEAELLKLEEDTSLTKGQKFVQEVVGSVGKKVITTAAAGALIYAGSAFISGEFDRKKLGEAMFYGGAKKKN